jgi:outer membrane protein OmpA-like peptidoglycan-associated protein
MNIAADLRIVDTRSLVVRQTVSLEKQITGYEVGFNVFRFFGDDLFDINIGAKNQEPLQLGVRTTIEAGILELLAGVAGVDAVSCLPDHLRTGITLSGNRPEAAESAANRQRAAPAAPPVAPAAGPAQHRPSLGVAREYQVAFEPGQSTVGGQSVGVIDSAAAAAEAGQTVTVVLVARDTESLGPASRDALTARRIEGVVEALARRGVSNDRVLVTWAPESYTAEMRRDGPGFQEIARLRVAGRG